jgi:hypothetical protein
LQCLGLGQSAWAPVHKHETQHRPQCTNMTPSIGRSAAGHNHDARHLAQHIIRMPSPAKPTSPEVPQGQPLRIAKVSTCRLQWGRW